MVEAGVYASPVMAILRVTGAGVETTLREYSEKRGA
jgi:hypothetical protein